MILTFQLSGEIILVKVDDERRLWMKTRMTNNEYVIFDKLVTASKQTTNKAYELTKRILSCKHCLSEKEDIEYYVIQEFLRTPEMQRAGIQHVTTEW